MKSKNKKTTIQVTKDLRKALIKEKEFKRQTYVDVIKKLIRQSKKQIK